MLGSDFSSARALLSWAREDAQKFDAEAKFFDRDDAYVFFEEVDPESGDIFYKCRIAPAPDHLRKLACHAVWDLKHALDHATCAAVSAVTDVAILDLPDMYFPWASAPTDLDRKLGNPKKPYPVELHRVFRGFEPYATGDGHTGGDDAFRAFGTIANTSKHRIALSAVPHAQFIGLKGTSSKRFRAFPGGLWDPEKNELTVALVAAGAELNMDFQIACHVCFRDVPAFQNSPAGLILDGAATAVEGIIDTLEAEVATILSTRG